MALTPSPGRAPASSAAPLLVLALLLSATSLPPQCHGARPHSLLSQVFQKPRGRMLSVQMQRDFVPRRELQTSCGLQSIAMTSRNMGAYPTKTQATANLYELNITNNCAYDLIGNAQFSNCSGFSGSERDLLKNPLSGAPCRSGNDDLLQVFPYYTPSGSGPFYSICQLYVNQDCSRSQVVQLFAGQRLTLYYADTSPKRMCGYNYTFSNAPTTRYIDTTNARQYCAVNSNLAGGISCNTVNGFRNCQFF